MTKIQAHILNMEKGLQALIDQAESIETEIYGIIPQKAINGFQDGLRGLQGIHLGELKNAFGIGVEQIKNDENLRGEIEELSKTLEPQE